MKNAHPSRWGTNYKDWHIPLSAGRLTLQDALTDMHALSHAPQNIPLIVQIVENPRFQLPGLELFHGAVDLDDHDCIHILLGRGMLPKDEAFVIGYTMGSTGKVGCFEEKLYRLVSHYLYPGFYQFSQNDLEVFKDALYLGAITRCQRLDRIDYQPLMDRPLDHIRKKLGIDTDLLRAYYKKEAKRFSRAAESRRLLN